MRFFLGLTAVAFILAANIDGNAQDRSELKPVAVKDGVAKLGPENSKIGFTGTHSPPKKPDPRVGGFGKFSGIAKVDADTLTSVSVEIDTASLWTEIPKLTTHLNSPDFFNTREKPKAKFESTSVKKDGDKHVIAGKLTLHSKTNEISFPADIAVSDEGLTIKADFSIDKSEFGMKAMPGVENKVDISVVVGDKTVKGAAKSR